MVRIIMLDHGLSRRIRILEDPVCGIEHSSSTFHGGCFLFLFFSVSFFSVSFFFFFFFSIRIDPMPKTISSSIDPMTPALDSTSA